jgi:hypothetical protein
MWLQDAPKNIPAIRSFPYFRPSSSTELQVSVVSPFLGDIPVEYRKFTVLTRLKTTALSTKMRLQRLHDTVLTRFLKQLRTDLAASAVTMSSWSSRGGSQTEDSLVTLVRSSRKRMPKPSTKLLACSPACIRETNVDLCLGFRRVRRVHGPLAAKLWKNYNNLSSANEDS